MLCFMLATFILIETWALSVTSLNFFGYSLLLFEIVSHTIYSTSKYDTVCISLPSQVLQFTIQSIFNQIDSPISIVPLTSPFFRCALLVIINWTPWKNRKSCIWISEDKIGARGFVQQETKCVLLVKWHVDFAIKMILDTNILPKKGSVEIVNGPLGVEEE